MERTAGKLRRIQSIECEKATSFKGTICYNILNNCYLKDTA